MLSKAGVPWDVIEHLSRTEVLGYCVAVGELEGREFAWSRMEWVKPK
jgi:hypothetical protein